MFDQENMQEMIRNTELEEATEKGVEQGIERGSQENAIQNAKNALALGLDFETISKITGLSTKEIEKLK